MGVDKINPEHSHDPDYDYAVEDFLVEFKKEMVINN